MKSLPSPNYPRVHGANSARVITRTKGSDAVRVSSWRVTSLSALHNSLLSVFIISSLFNQPREVMFFLSCKGELHCLDKVSTQSSYFRSHFFFYSKQRLNPLSTETITKSCRKRPYATHTSSTHVCTLRHTLATGRGFSCITLNTH